MFLVAGAAAAQQTNESLVTSKQPVEPLLTSVTGTLDEDFLFFSNTDRNYTMGLSFRSAGRWVAESHLAAPLDGIDWLSQSARLHAWMYGKRDQLPEERLSMLMETHSMAILGSGFTPDRIDERQVITTDRPYGSLLVLQIGHQTIDMMSRMAFRSELTVGAIGLRVAEVMQTTIHRTLRACCNGTRPDPLGWPNQISDGGEPTFKYLIGFDKEVLSLGSWFDATWSSEAEAGYYTSIATGLNARFGMIRSDFWKLDPYPNSGISRLSELEVERIRDPRAFEIYGWASLRGRLIAYNALLEGQFRKSEFELTNDQIQHAQLEFSAGFWLRCHAFALNVALITGRTPEHLLAERRAHIWGGVTIGYVPMPEPAARPVKK